MIIKDISNEKLGEKYFKIKHPSGLTIFIMPKEDYSSTYAVFATKYGSIDNIIKRKDGSFVDIPAGTAHFLEHKLFESEDLDAFARFAQTGANANAYTGFDRTAYLFSCSSNFKENLEILLDFVQSPYFTQETVEKEQGIIGQEIRMYKDSAMWEVMFNLLMALYRVHPVRIDIAGTEESIAQITADTLYDCYKSFYNLKNMALAVVGNVTVEDVLETADKLLKSGNGEKAQRKFTLESPEPVKTYTEEKLAVNTEQFLLGFKENITTPELTLKEKIGSQIALEATSGKASHLYKKLFDSELINTSFSHEHFNGFGYSAALFGGETKDPQKATQVIKAEIKNILTKGIPEIDFKRAKRKLYGRMIMQYNDIDDLANNLIETHFNNNGLFDEIEICKSVTLDYANQRLNELLNEQYSALSVIKPLSCEKEA
ncbi:MAG TPA: pitrilysin family protein [Clostridia bacterium]|nr:pitrilysin family protein [Clostridia bacterium]